MNIQENVSLKPYNTFGLDVTSRWFLQLNTVDDIKEFLSNEHFASLQKLILGGGSNVLLLKDYPGIVLQNKIMGKEIVKEEGDFVWVKAGAGETWHDFVLWTIENGWGGLENLSLIPGSVGAAPMQNIGAYGAEIKDTFFQLEAVNRSTGEIEVFDLDTCEFGYRSSIFKTIVKDQYIIVNVSFRLFKKPVFNISYGAIEQQLETDGVKELSLRAVSNAVIKIRQSKLPDPKQIGNAGSFFKNPVVDTELFEAIKKEYPDVANYPLENGLIKLAAGWLIDKSGWKGKRFDNYGVHEKQALVLVNYSDASGKQIYDLSEKIMKDIHSKFGVQLEREVNII